jgi:MoaA/NifB/PqqE/SkfB family radical SAM enzyme
MKKMEVIQAWGRILSGRAPSMSIEITKECPLRCPGCYAYEDAHLGGLVTLRQLSDFRGDALVERVLELVDRERPLHLSIVGGDPLVRFRELERLLPQLSQRGIFTQVVTSAFRPIPRGWAALPRLGIVVSIDGLQPEHDARRKPATYERILKNIEGQRIVVHCTITGQLMKRPGYREEFLRFWSAREEVRKIWISLFTPQRGAVSEECLTDEERQLVVREMLEFREKFPKLDMHKGQIAEFLRPPQSPEECIFARTTTTLSADLQTRVTPCQFGGDPDCAHCGCVASMGMAAVGNYRLGGLVPLKHIFNASTQIGRVVSTLRPNSVPLTQTPLPSEDAAT